MLAMAIHCWQSELVGRLRRKKVEVERNHVQELDNVNVAEVAKAPFQVRWPMIVSAVDSSNEFKTLPDEERRAHPSDTNHCFSRLDLDNPHGIHKLRTLRRV